MSSRRKLPSKQELLEIEFRGGYELGYQAALATLQESVSELEGRLDRLREWAEDDPTLPTEPPLDGELRDVSRA